MTKTSATTVTDAHPIMFEAADQGEENARADVYGLLSTLFYSPPSQSLLASFADAPVGGDSLLEQAWTVVVQACQAAQQEAVREEYEELFIGVGKPEVMLYGSYYLSGFLMEKPLAELRTDLAALGIQRSSHVVESEDHLATLCEVMQHLIVPDGIHANLSTQQQFFSTHMRPWVLECCAAIERHPKSRFYKNVAGLAHQFFEVEMVAFDMV